MFGCYKVKTLSLAPIPITIGTWIRKEGCFNVRMEGLEPPCLAALDPKSSASTNFATSALPRMLAVKLDSLKLLVALDFLVRLPAGKGRSTNFATSAYSFVAKWKASKKLERKSREYFLLSKVVESI